MWEPDIEGVPADIIRCVRTILTTPTGAVVLDRDFGVDADIIDLPMPLARARYVVEVVEKVQRYEPRVRVSDVSFTHDPESGILKPKVVLTLVA